jgi:hypothetical protein
MSLQADVKTRLMSSAHSEPIMASLLHRMALMDGLGGLLCTVHVDAVTVALAALPRPERGTARAAKGQALCSEAPGVKSCLQPRHLLREACDRCAWLIISTVTVSGAVLLRSDRTDSVLCACVTPLSTRALVVHLNMLCK